MKRTTSAAIVLAGLTLSASAHGDDLIHYRGNWTIQQDAVTRATDLHLRIDIDNSDGGAHVHVPFNRVFGPFTTCELDQDVPLPDFQVNWDNPTADIVWGQWITIGFDFKTDRSFSIADAYWTLDGARIADADPLLFTFQAVPAPGTASLCAASGLMFIRRRRR